MKKHRRKILAALVLLVLLLAGGLTGAHWWVGKQTTPAALVKQLEKSLNCRAEIAGSKVSLFSFPATLEVTGLRLLPRDAENSKAPKDRLPPKKIETVLVIPRLAADLDLPALLNREVRIGQLTLTGVEAATIRKKDGENTLATMLGSPPEAPPDPNLPPPPPSEPKAESKPFAAALTLAKLEHATLSVRNEKKKQLIQIGDLNLTLTNLSYAPALPGSPPAAPAPGAPPSVVESSLHLTSTDLKDQRQQMDITIGVRSTLPPLQQASAADGATLDLTFKAGSYLDRIPTLEKLGIKLGKLKDQIGLDLTSFPVSGRLERDTAVKAKMTNGLLTFEEDTNFNFDTCRIKLKKGSTFNPDDQSHHFDGIFAANEKVSQEAIAGVETWLKTKGDSLGPIIRDTVLKKLINDKGLLTIPFTSTEDIGRPEVNFSRSFEKVISDGLKDLGKELLNDTLKGGDSLKGLIESLGK
jgi:hypothetical protein